jgi:hypothetical protein
VEAGRCELASGSYGGGKRTARGLTEHKGGVGLGCRVEEGKGGLIRRGVKEGGGLTDRRQDPGKVALGRATREQGSGTIVEGRYGEIAGGLAWGKRKKWARPKATMSLSNYSKKFKWA